MSHCIGASTKAAEAHYTVYKVRGRRAIFQKKSSSLRHSQNKVMKWRHGKLVGDIADNIKTSLTYGE